jgi:hypothetical protein
MRVLGLTIDHPSGRDRATGSTSQVSLTIDRGLRSGKADAIPLTEDELLRLVARGAVLLAILRGVRT